ncbi:cytochrome P450 [Lasiosphaeris hirsuta]|uniref:Cytochrome P450 n=1 Tax=Lasiosphaeris hirsuta TaxID=260670 RepID=A0AA40DN91_9PEZI|nr:cytochrome P450 [Lasiosphaeris hirsuta]
MASSSNSTTLPTLAIVTTTLILVLVYAWVLHPSLLSPLARIPNAHWSAPFSRLWILRVRFGHRENRTLLDAHRRLGPVVRVAPGEISVNDSEGVRAVYGGGWEKGDYYGVFDNYGVPCMFSAKSAAEHSARKRLISHVYSKSFVQSEKSPVAGQARKILYARLMPILREEGATLDAYSVFMAATMDFIAAYIFGIKGGTDFLRGKGYRDHFFELYKARNDYGIYDQELPWMTAFCRRVGISLCPAWVDYANKELGEWCQKLCKGMTERKEENAQGEQDKAVVWDALVRGLQTEAATSGVESVLHSTALARPDLSIASELFDHVLAGQETAGLTLTYLSWRLSQSPNLQAELRAELLRLTPNMRFVDGGEKVEGSIPGPKQLDNLPILHAVIMETLRLHAPIPGPQPRQTPDAGGQLGPYFIPGGVRVAAMAYGLHQNEEVFPDPERWNHRRWLPSGASEDDRKKRNRQFWAFSSGGRMCIGSNFAMHEMKLVAAAVYSNYTSHIVDDEGMAQQTDGYTGRPQKERLFLRYEKVAA